ncbi:MAG: hypothetical protein KBI01_08020 [Oscillospiraceae bacterium]|nr:hypothetical protein [Oscillospiraceae bacterium]
MKYEYEFKMDQMFDRNEEYDLFICSCCFALSDLLIINQEILEAVSNPQKWYSSTFFRINMGFAREAYELLKSKFTNESFKKEYLLPIENAVERYTKIDNIINGKTELMTFKEHKLNENRHLIFHYPKKEEDYCLIQEVLCDLEKDGQKFRYYESDNTDDSENQKFEFAAIIQFNALFGIHKADGNDSSRIINDLAILTTQIISLLELLFGEFVSKKQWSIAATNN